MMKKKSGKRFLSWLLAVVMIIALMPATAFAEPPTESSGNTETAVTAYCPSSEGGTITLKDHDTDNTGKITLKAQWEDQKYPVYVYGLFKYKNTTFDKNSSLYINGSTDSINLNNDSFITFGALNDATTFDPAPLQRSRCNFQGNNPHR